MSDLNKKIEEILASMTKPLVKEDPYLHAMLFGPMGGGKSYTSMLCAVGLYEWLRQNQKEIRPVLLVNTEKSARWLFDDFQAAKVPVRLAETKSPADLLKLMDAARDGAFPIVVIDSLTHHWYSFVDAYREKYRVEFMSLRDWGRVIPEWRASFSDRFVQAPYNYFLCGRSGFEYTSEKDEKTGKKEIYKTGVRVKLEGETGYEPDLVVYTDRIEILKEDRPKVAWEATVLKSRHKETSGKTFINASWKDFEPAFLYLVKGSQPSVKLPESSSTELFDSGNGAAKRKREILIEKIEGLMVSIAPGQTSQEKKWKVDVLEKCFGSRSWMEISGMDIEKLEAGLEKMEKDRKRLEEEHAQLS